MSREQRPLLAAATIGLVVTLAACGTASPAASGASSAATQETATPAPRTPQPRPTPTPTRTTAGVLTAANFKGTLLAAYAKAQTYAFTVAPATEESGVEGVAITGVVRATPTGTPDIGLTMVYPEGGTLELRIVAKVWYLGDPSTGAFVIVDPSDPDGPAAGFGGSVDAIDPGVAVTQNTILSVEPTGRPEVLDGVPCQPYDVVIDTQAGFDRSGDAAPTGAQTRATVHYWVGPDALVRRFTVDSANGGPLDISFSHWGEPVHLRAPRPDEITTLDALRALEPGTQV